MLKYTLRRLLQLIPTLLVVSFIVFAMVRLIPGDPITLLYGISEGAGTDSEYLEFMRDQYGLNDPLPVQYFNYIRNILHGDLGTSLYTHKPIATEIANRYQSTIVLAVGGTLVGSILGVLLGIIAAVKHNKLGDNIVMVLSMIFVSTPSFFLAMILMLVFSLQLRWLPSMGMKGPAYAVLPILTLGLHAVGMIARTTRSSMLDTINQDYIRTSKARGVSKFKIIMSHTLKNALIPILTAIGLRFGQLLAGAALVETVFSIPGLGRFMVDGISNRDYPVIQSTVLLFATTFVVVNTLVDLLYGFVDPRVKYN
ncbi:MAG: ABC transporter permease [Clostridiales bacterium]|nr:ABC transporter permease [Clostridiales bacterium]MDO4349829.1 ABC transporter permease [Eubacteriales bacterium]